jgi:hypothetical protein
MIRLRMCNRIKDALMDDSVPRIDGARRRADAIFGKAARQDPDVVEQQRQLRQRETEKLLRLRSLRQAKEASDQEARALAGRTPSRRKKPLGVA